jgi:hypothetical protein
MLSPGSAVNLTKEYGEIYPAGAMCHVELLIQLKQGKWVKMSVSKKRCIDGVWLPGCVHMEASDPAEWKSKYIFLSVTACRYSIKQMARFFQTQAGNKFNPYSYYGALFFGWGVQQFHPTMLKEQHPDGFFCSEAIAAALQCLVHHMRHQNISNGSWQSNVLRWRCDKTNPNQMFRELCASYGVSHAFKPGVSTIDSV